MRCEIVYIVTLNYMRDQDFRLGEWGTLAYVQSRRKLVSEIKQAPMKGGWYYVAVLLD